LVACKKLIKATGQMFLSCPNTMDKKDPYDTQYAAHLYEWDVDELTEALDTAGFEISQAVGLTAKKREFDVFMSRQPKEEQEWYADLGTYLPTPWLMAIAPIRYPEAASEVLLVCHPKGQRRQNKRFKRPQGDFKGETISQQRFDL
jgi:hypothetical protein